MERKEDKLGWDGVEAFCYLISYEVTLGLMRVKEIIREKVEGLAVRVYSKRYECSLRDSNRVCIKQN